MVVNSDVKFVRPQVVYRFNAFLDMTTKKRIVLPVVIRLVNTAVDSCDTQPPNHRPVRRSASAGMHRQPQRDASSVLEIDAIAELLGVATEPTNHFDSRTTQEGMRISKVEFSVELQ